MFTEGRGLKAEGSNFWGVMSPMRASSVPLGRTT